MAENEDFELESVALLYCPPDKHGSELKFSDMQKYVFHVPKVIKRFLNEHQRMGMQIEVLEEEIVKLKEENERLKSQLLKRVL